MYRLGFVVALSAILGLAVQPVSAQPIPGGSYQQSCRNGRVRNGQLVADCSAANGQRITSSVNLFCNGDIGNVNGYLRCNGGGRYNGGRPPAGTYAQSCTNARMNGSTLVANCSAPNGSRITSSLDIARCRRAVDIGNRNGYLHCAR